jgi:hypothetical protein
MDALRRKLIEGSGSSGMQLDTLRIRLIKIGGRVRELLTKIHVHLAWGHPGRIYGTPFRQLSLSESFMDNPG